MVDPTSDDTTSGTDPSMTSTSTASTTTVDPMTSGISLTGDVTGTTDSSTGMTTDGPTTDPTLSTDATTDADSSSTGEPAENVVLDFTMSPCMLAMSWSGDLTDPGANNDAYPIVCGSDASSPTAAEGWAYPVTAETPATVEPGMEFTDEAIAMHPPEEVDGWVYGHWAETVYEPEDVFRARVWCLSASICEVEVALGASVFGSGPAVVETWPLTFEGSIDIDISLHDAGILDQSSSGLALMVSTGEAVGNDGILWEYPRIVRPDP